MSAGADVRPNTGIDLAGHRAVVTGAASGLGRSFAYALSRAGAAVACLDRDPATDTADAIREWGGDAISLTADVADEHSMRNAAREVGALGPPHILVNNAGVTSLPGRLLDVELSEWDRVLSVNLRGLFVCTRAMMPGLLATKAASIINIASFIGLVGVYPGFPVTALPYATSKAGIAGFTRQLAVEYARDGVRVNAIAPGWHGGTNLGRARRLTATEGDIARFEGFLAGAIPMGHRGKPDDLAGLLVYLASDLSRYVTGQVFAHDGGLTAA